MLLSIKNEICIQHLHSVAFQDTRLMCARASVENIEQFDASLFTARPKMAPGAFNYAEKRSLLISCSYFLGVESQLSL